MVGDDGIVYGVLGGPLKPRFNKGNGYYYVRVRREDFTTEDWPVNVIVCKTFIGDCPDGQESRHYDGDKSNNRLSNLSWGTHKQNMEDNVRLGKTRKKTACYA